MKCKGSQPENTVSIGSPCLPSLWCHFLPFKMKVIFSPAVYPYDYLCFFFVIPLCFTCLFCLTSAGGPTAGQSRGLWSDKHLCKSRQNMKHRRNEADRMGDDSDVAEWLCGSILITNNTQTLQGNNKLKTNMIRIFTVLLAFIKAGADQLFNRG